MKIFQDCNAFTATLADWKLGLDHRSNLGCDQTMASRLETWRQVGMKRNYTLEQQRLCRHLIYSTPFGTGIGWGSLLSYFIYKCQGGSLSALNTSFLFKEMTNCSSIWRSTKLGRKACQKTQQFNALIINMWCDWQDYIPLQCSFKNIHWEHEYNF